MVKFRDDGDVRLRDGSLESSTGDATGDPIINIADAVYLIKCCADGKSRV